MEQYFLQFLNIYFWTFTICAIIGGGIRVVNKKNLEESKENSIKNGTFSIKLNYFSLIGLSLSILSIITTWIK